MEMTAAAAHQALKDAVISTRELVQSGADVQTIEAAVTSLGRQAAAVAEACLPTAEQFLHMYQHGAAANGLAAVLQEQEALKASAPTPLKAAKMQALKQQAESNERILQGVLNAFVQGRTTAYKALVAEFRPSSRSTSFIAADGLLDAAEQASGLLPAEWVTGTIAVQSVARSKGVGGYTPQMLQDVAGDASERFDAVAMPATADQAALYRDVFGDLILEEGFLGRDGAPFTLEGVQRQAVFIKMHQPVKAPLDSDRYGRHLVIIDGAYRLSDDEGWYRVAEPVNGVHLPTVTVDEGAADLVTLLVHELTHHAEHTVQDGLLMRLEDAFLARRTQGAALQPYGQVTGSIFGDSFVLDGGFSNLYVGKQYLMARSREVLAMGVEALLCGTLNTLVGVPGTVADLTDDDHKAFTLGCLLAI